MTVGDLIEALTSIPDDCVLTTTGLDEVKEFTISMDIKFSDEYPEGKIQCSIYFKGDKGEYDD